MPSAECRNRGRRMPPDAIKRAGWREDGILVVDVNDPELTWLEREAVRNLGNRMFGIGKHSRPEGVSD